MSPHGRSVYRWAVLAIIAGCVAVSYLVITHRAARPGPTAAAGPRPAFQLPFPCGEVWTLTTYPGHDDFDIDFFAASGATAGRSVLASAAGTVTWAGWSATLEDGRPAAPGASGTRGGLGYGVIIDHGGGWFTEYGHLAAAPGVRTGETVKGGQGLGVVGHTGSTTIDHLHYEQLNDTLDPKRTRGNGDKVEAVFDGVPSGITSDDRSPEQTRTSRNCAPPGA
ncbi:M23 family metallopeptidase [Dactylosporangium sp. NPDC049140]|uniref:M23 family metallopeptidase n=1 Tax=Dactylosporangium sp. NPDC049140 TaxID=3155647 RepID=UPI0033C31C2D